MPLPSRKERSAIMRQLKEFAFEQSPMFKDGAIQSMELSQSYEFIEKMPEDIVKKMPGTLPFEQTKIVLGFCATRFIVDTGKPAYTFEVTNTGTSLIHPRELVLDDDDWHDLSHAYLEEGDADTEIPEGSVIEDIEVLGSEEIRDEVIDAIGESGHECELYQKVQYVFSTEEPAIETSYERATAVNNAMHGFVSTTYHVALDSNWEAVKTPDGVHFIPPRLSPEELPIADEIDVSLRFFELVRKSGLQSDASMNTLTPEKDKVAEMLYLVDCMRARRIKTLGSLKD